MRRSVLVLSAAIVLAATAPADAVPLPSAASDEAVNPVPPGDAERAQKRAGEAAAGRTASEGDPSALRGGASVAPGADTASEASRAGAAPGRVFLRLPVVDLPFNTLGGSAYPSMQQSLHLLAALGQAGHHTLFRWSEKLLPPVWDRIAAVAAVALFDVVFLSLPLVWHHEEWHRAVMTSRGIASFNDVYSLRVTAGTIAVSHVADEDLVRLKRDHPWDMIRLSSAGMEGELELSRHFQKLAFAQRLSAAPDLIASLMATVSVLGYRNLCAGTRADRTTDAINEEDGTDVAIRDFTGLDCDAWVYDLHRPDEPYEARGVHPSGVGLDRYIRYSDLTLNEQRLLRQVRNLGLLNLVSPFFFGISSFRVTSPFDGAPLRVNGALRHHLTTYGHELSVESYFGRGDLNVAVSYRHGLNARGHFPALEAELIRFPLQLGDTRSHLSAAVTGWLQPEDQSWFAATATAGGRARITLDVPMRDRLELMFEAEAKSEGWVAGIVEIGPAFAFRSGVVLAL